MNEKHAKSNNQLHIESRALTARAQLIDALSVFGTVGQFLLRADPGDFTQREGGKLDGGTKEAVEATMINACNRLDAILNDATRWELKDRDNLESKIQASYDASAELLKEQRNATAEMNTPHSRYSPHLLRVRPGLWMAILGTLANVEGSIVGLGESPKAALECFDSCFNGELTQEQTNYINNLTHEATKNMVPKRIGETQNSENSGSSNTRDSRETGPEHSFSGEESPPHAPGADPDYDDPYADPGNAPTGDPDH